MTTRLARLESVDLRTIWPSEPKNFTPWLAKEESLALLGDTIGIDLELVGEEQRFGPFSADILCKDTGNNQFVVIENQLGRTDHDHFGKLLTYSAGLDAFSGVWIAKRFTDEHRAVVDWLNEATDDRFSFFGLEIELWTIADSPAAPKFNIVSKPNDWSDTVSGTARHSAARGLTEKALLQQEYWSALKELLLDNGGLVRSHKPQPQNWATFTIRGSNVQLLARVNRDGKNCTSVGLNLSGPDAKAHFHLLAKDRTAVEREMGAPLDWMEQPNGKESNIEIKRDDTDFTKRDDWPRQHEWIAEKLNALHRTFSDRIKKLNAAG